MASIIMQSMEILIVAWLVGLGLYFWKTTPRQRENHIIVVWVLLLLPAIYYPIMRLFGL